MAEHYEAVTVEEMQRECAARLRLLEAGDEIVRRFESEGAVLCSAKLHPERPAAVYELSAFPEMEKKVAEIQAGFVMVYHAIVTGDGSEDFWSLLYVSPDRREWLQERSSIKFAYSVSAYVYGDGGRLGPESVFIGARHCESGGIERFG